MRLQVGMVVAAIAGATILGSCDWDGVTENPQPNESPTVRITGGASEGLDADYRVEFFWFGSDPDGTVSHFLYAIDDTCLCAYTIEEEIDDGSGGTVTVQTEVKSNDLAECEAAGVELFYADPDSIWKRTDLFSGSFNFEADDDPRPGDPPTSSEWHTFFIKAVDDKGAESQPDRRLFNAVTVAPTAGILEPVGVGAEKLARVSTFFNLRWDGRDEDSSEAERKPAGYQLKLIELTEIEGLSTDETSIVRLFTHVGDPETGWSSLRRDNLLIPDSLSVEEPDGSGIPFDPLPSDEHYYETDWWPKASDPYVGDSFQFRNLPVGFYAVAVRAVDQAGAVMPDTEHFVQDEANPGSVLKLEVANIPVNPHLTVIERNLLGGDRFTAPGEQWRVEVPVNVELEFTWTWDAGWYGADEGNTNFALDIPDPSCTQCGSSNGIGGWIGWGRTNTFRYTFNEEDAGQQHVLYIKARDESDREDREIVAVIVMDVIAFSFDRTAMFVDDFTASGIRDCDQDDFLRPIVQNAIEPHLELGESLDLFDARSSVGFCQERNSVQEITLATLSRYKLLYWNVAAGGSGTLLGDLTDPSPSSEFGKYLSIYVRAGGNLVVWGRQSVGALNGDSYFQDTSIRPELAQFPDSDFGPGSFLWDIMRFRTEFDRAPRGVVNSLKLACSGLVGMEASSVALAEGFPMGTSDPTGYRPEQVAIWHDSYTGRANPNGGFVSAPTGSPPLIAAGLDTLYTMIPNAWAHEEVANPDYDPSDPESPEFINNVFGVCLTSRPRLSESPVMLRYEDPVGGQGRVVWFGSQFYDAFNDAEAETGAVTEIVAKATDWIFSTGDGATN